MENIIGKIINFEAVKTFAITVVSKIDRADLIIAGCVVLCALLLIYFGRILLVEKYVLKLMVKAEKEIQGYKVGNQRFDYVVQEIWKMIPALKLIFKNQADLGNWLKPKVEMLMAKAIEIVRQDVIKRENEAIKK